jgi:hypothetical protein
VKEAFLEVTSPDNGELGPCVLIDTMTAKPGFSDVLQDSLLSLVSLTRQKDDSVVYHPHRDRAGRKRFCLL